MATEENSTAQNALADEPHSVHAAVKTVTEAEERE
jgi:hypothetical protein